MNINHLNLLDCFGGQVKEIVFPSEVLNALSLEAFKNRLDKSILKVVWKGIGSPVQGLFQLYYFVPVYKKGREKEPKVV